MNRKHLQLALLIISSLLLALIIAYVYQNTRVDSQNQDLRSAGIIELPKARPLPAVDLLYSEGGSFSTSQFKDKWYLVYFGYTFCPDICPTSLAQMLQIRQQLSPQALEQVEFVMISVDPLRDTPEQLRAYLNFFHPEFKGFSGELDDIQKLSSALGIPFIPGDSSQPGYTVDHSGNLAIINPEGKHFGFIQAPFKIDAVAAQLNLLVPAAELPPQ